MLQVLYEACTKAAELEEICLMLLEFGADPNKATVVRQETALHAAARNGATQVPSFSTFEEYLCIYA